jgi:hypothetical protein
MLGLDPGIHVLLSAIRDKNVDGRVKPGHDAVDVFAHGRNGNFTLAECQEED